MKPLIGCKEEEKILEKALASDEAELIAVSGRQRVGKTFLIREFFNSKMILEFSGVHTLKEQLGNFRNKLAEVMKQEILPEVPLGWTEAFEMLKKYSEPLLNRGKCIIFLDEFPWLNTPKSGFLSAFEYFWNSWGTKQDNLILIICGSAASWMIQKVVNNKGGFHNRITKKIRLLPFTLAETKEYLDSRNVKLELYQIVQLYMVMGGIPHYLKEVEAPVMKTALMFTLITWWLFIIPGHCWRRRIIILLGEVTKSDGAGGRVVVTGKNNPISTSANCWGYALAGAHLVIEDNTIGSVVVKTILKDDGYKVDGFKVNGIKQVVSDEDVTGFIITSGNGEDALHIGFVNDDDTWSADQGIYKPDEHVTKLVALGRGGQNKSAEVRNISNADRNKGKATGVKIVNQAQIRKILEQLKLSGAKKVLDGILYEN